MARLIPKFQARFADQFDFDMACALRAEGVRVQDICSILEASHASVCRYTRHIVAAIDNRAIARERMIARQREIRAERAETRRRALARYRSFGMQFSDAAKLVGLSEKHAQEVCPRVQPKGFVGIKSVAVQALGKKQRRQPVPAWAQKAGLTQDYRDLCREFGEHHAARECRRLKAEASRACL